MPPESDDRSPETAARLESQTATGAATPVSDRPPSGGAAPDPAMGSASPPPGTTATEFLDAFLQQKSELFRESREVLRDSYVPARLPHRDGEIRQVAEVLAPALRGDVPSNLLIYGKIGTGKTAVVTQVRQDIQRRAEGTSKVTFVTVNCGNIDTAYSLLQNVGNTFAKTEADRIPTGWSLDRVQAAMRRLMDTKGGTIVLVLDEIDRLVARSGDNVLYTLSQLNTELETARLVLLGISNDLKFTNHLDARVRSRLNEEKILFDPYKAPQLQDILQDRAKVAFRDGVVDPGVIELCAAYAQLESGDARRALALLRLAAEMAERDHAKRITRDHVVKAKNRLEKDIIIECCRSLPPHCKVLLYAILQSYERRRTGVLDRRGLRQLQAPRRAPRSRTAPRPVNLELRERARVAGPHPRDDRLPGPRRPHSGDPGRRTDLGDDARARRGPAPRADRSTEEPRPDAPHELRQSGAHRSDVLISPTRGPAVPAQLTTASSTTTGVASDEAAWRRARSRRSSRRSRSSPRSSTAARRTRRRAIRSRVAISRSRASSEPRNALIRRRRPRSAPSGAWRRSPRRRS